jgi:hypothetical protein
MEYSSTNNSFESTFVDRKYYIDGMYLNNSGQVVNLYLLEDTRSSDVVLSVVDKITGEGIDGAYIQIQRFYPENGSYLTVEVEKTDNNGQTLGKMVLADVFYKFIITKDGLVLSNTPVEKILSLTKKFYVSITQDYLESWRYIGEVGSIVTCNSTTNICVFTWSDTNNIVQTGILRVYRINGMGRRLISEQKSTSVSGTLFYHITETMTGNSYMAQGLIMSDTENSLYQVGEAWLSTTQKLANFFGKSGMLIGLLLFISVGAIFLDVGGVGVIAGSLLALVTLTLVGVVPFNLVSVMSLIIIGIILIGKMRS